MESKDQDEINDELIIDILKKKSSDRTNEDIKTLVGWSKQLATEFFRKLSTETLTSLFKYVFVEEFNPSTPIVIQGEIGDKFYIILKGDAVVYIKQEADELERDSFRKKNAKNYSEYGLKVSLLKKGTGFGEVALISEVPRTATIVANKKVVCLVVGKKDFRDAQESSKSSSLSTKIEFLQNCSFFSRWSHGKRISFAYALKRRKFFKSAVIYSQGDTPSSVFFIEEGECKLSTKFDFEPNGKLISCSYQSEMSNTDSGKTKHKIKTIHQSLDVAQLGTNSYFGDIEVILSLPKRLETAVAVSDVSLYEISQVHFKSYVRGVMLNKITDFCISKMDMRLLLVERSKEKYLRNQYAGSILANENKLKSSTELWNTQQNDNEEETDNKLEKPKFIKEGSINNINVSLSSAAQGSSMPHAFRINTKELSSRKKKNVSNAPRTPQHENSMFGKSFLFLDVGKQIVTQRPKTAPSAHESKPINLEEKFSDFNSEEEIVSKDDWIESQMRSISLRPKLNQTDRLLKELASVSKIVTSPTANSQRKSFVTHIRDLDKKSSSSSNLQKLKYPSRRNVVNNLVERINKEKRINDSSVEPTFRTYEGDIMNSTTRKGKLF